MKQLINAIPKAELHIHIEGALEPELMFQLARRNDLQLRFDSVDALRHAYHFSDLQSFLDLYYEGIRVLLTEDDFFDLTWAYLKRAHADHVRHCELFFDPQSHTMRGIPFSIVINGIHRALERAETQFNLTSRLIPCFLRHLTAEEAMVTLQQLLPYRQWIVAVGLDSSERGHPPEQFAAVFERAREEGFLTVAHAGEEGPPDYIWQALEQLKVSRIDHGVRADEDPLLLEQLKRLRIPLTVCPLSNVRLKVFKTMAEHNLKQLLEYGLCVTVNSDDPAYFGGYINDNFLALQQALELDRQAIFQLARNSFEAAFLSNSERQRLLNELDQFIGRAVS